MEFDSPEILNEFLKRISSDSGFGYGMSPSCHRCFRVFESIAECFVLMYRILATHLWKSIELSKLRLELLLLEKRQMPLLFALMTL